MKQPIKKSKLITKDFYEDIAVAFIRTTIIKPYLYIKKKKKKVHNQLSFPRSRESISRTNHNKIDSHLHGNDKRERDPSTPFHSAQDDKQGDLRKRLKRFFQNLFKLATYENILIAILRFLINRNPISPLYALTKIVKRKLTKKIPPSLPLEKGGSKEEKGYANLPLSQSQSADEAGGTQGDFQTTSSKNISNKGTGLQARSGAQTTLVIPSLSRNPLMSKLSTQSDPCLAGRQASTPFHSARDDKKEDSSNKKTTVHNQLSFPRSRESLPCGQAGIRKANHRSCHSELVEESLRAKESNAKRSLSADKAGFDFAGDDKQTYHKLKHHFSSHHPYLSASSSILTYLLIIGGISFYLFTNYYTQANAWWNDDWHYRKSITINSSQVTADLTNFPMLVSITDPQLADKAQTDGDDIVFTENQGNKLDHEIESFDSSTGALVAWVRIPELDSDNDSQLFMYYGNPTVDNQQRAEEVWDENFKLVQHLEETGTGTRTDSTRNNSDGSTNGYDGDEATTGQVNGADDLDGSDDYISIANSSAFDFLSTNVATFSAWVRSENVLTDQKIIDFGVSSDTDVPYFEIGNGNSNKVAVGRASGALARAATTLQNNTWHYIVYTRSGDGATSAIYVDGQSQALEANGTNDFENIEAIKYIGHIEGDTDDFLGILDEIRVQSINRSANWIATEYNNQNSPATFISLGAEERGNAPVLYLPFDEGFGTTAHDETSYRNDGTIVGATWKNEEDCRSGKCLEFDGTGDYVEIADDSSLDLKEEVTLEAWVKPTTTNLDNQTIISKTETPSEPTKIYRSVGPSATSAIATGTTNAMTIIGDRATFATALPTNVGVGDVIQYDVDGDSDIDASDSLAFVIERISSFEYKVNSAQGGLAVAVSSDQNWSLFRAYTSLANAESGIENTGIDADLRNFDDWTAGGDATTSDVGKDLVTANQQWNIACYANGTTADATYVDVNGWTTNINNFIKIYTPVDNNQVGISQRHNGKWDNNYYKLEITGNTNINVRTVDVWFDGLQLKQSASSGTSNSVIHFYSVNKEIKFSNNIFVGNYTGTVSMSKAFDFETGYNNSVFKIWNNLFYNFVSPGGNDRVFCLCATTGVADIYSNTIVNSTMGFNKSASITTTLKNNIVQATSDGYIGTFAAASDYNISNIAADAPGANSKNSTTVSFISTTPGSEDFHLSPTDTAAKDAGADLSGDEVFPFASDIDGQTRPAKGGFDIGADEARATQIYRSVGPGKTDALEMGDGNALSIVGSIATFQRALADNVGVGDVIQYDDDNDGDIDASDSLAFITGRISNFQYTISNASGGVPTEVIGDNNWSLFRAYTSLYNAEAGTENTGIDADLRNFDTWSGGKDLVTSKEQWNIACFANGTTADTVLPTISGWTTATSTFIKIFTPANNNEVGVSQRHAGVWSNEKYILSPTGVSYRGIQINVKNVIIDGLQIMAGDQNQDAINVDPSIPYTLTVSNSIIKNSRWAVYAGNNNLATGMISVNNVIAYNINAGCFSGETNATLDFNLYNSTCYNFNLLNLWYGFFTRHSDNHNRNVKNCIAVINPSATLADDYDVGTYVSASNNISSDTTAPGTSALISQTLNEIDFVSTVSGSEDLHILGTSVARNAGVDLSADANLSFLTDIDGDTRQASSTTWDIGADEAVATKIYRSVGPGNTSALATDESHENTVSVTDGVATFSAGLADRIGVGDAVLIDTNADNAITSADTLLFIHGRNSSVSYDLRTHTGALPTDIATNDTYQIYRAHTSLFNAEAGIENTAIPVTTFNGGNRDLVTNNEEWNIACYGDAVDTTTVDVNGWTTGVENFINIYTPVNFNEVGITQRHSGKWDNSKYKLESLNSVASILIEDEFVKVSGLQIIPTRNDGTNGAGIQVYSLSGTENDVWISNNIIKQGASIGTGSMHGIRAYNSTIVDMKVWNNIVYDFTQGSASGIILSSGLSAYFYNNTIHSSDSCISVNTGTVVAKNNITQNCANGYSGTFDTSSDFNISDLAADAPGTHSKNSTTVTFRDEANDDFRLAMTDTSAKGAGLNLTYDANLPITNDIEGELRPSLRDPSTSLRSAQDDKWDIGADQISGTIHNNYSLNLKTNYPQVNFSTADNDNDNFSSGDINLEANTWSHLVYKRNADSEEMFINGSKKDSGTISDFLKTNGGKLYLGAENFSSKNSFKGLMDEIRIYNYARTETEVKKDTTAGSSGRAASRASEGVSVAIGDKSSGISDGLVGHWKMDEASWNGTVGEVVDASGNENHGTAQGNATIAGGKYGSGGSFDGNDESVDIVMEMPTRAYTKSAWVMRGGAADYPNILSEVGGAVFWAQNSSYKLAAGHSGAINAVSDTDSLDLNRWYNAVVTYDPDLDSGTMILYKDGVEIDRATGVGVHATGNNVRIGRYANAFDVWNGKIDEARIYNRALSPAEVRELYEYAPGPVLHLKMDEKEGTTAFDSSGNNNHGTLVNGPIWENGKHGSALSFDSSHTKSVDIVNSSSLTTGWGAMTVSFWGKMDEIESNISHVFISKNRSGFLSWSIGKYQTSNNDRLSMSLKNSDGVSYSLLQTNQWAGNKDWNYISMVYDGSYLRMYINGIESATPISATGTISNFDTHVCLGTAWNGLECDTTENSSIIGKLDDVKIYNYARTQEQILEDMSAKGGSASGGSALKSPILDLDFNEGFGATAHDKSGNENNGTLTPGATGANTTATMMWDKGGKFGGSVEFDGDDDYVYLGAGLPLPTNQLTYSAWVNLNGVEDTSNDHRVIFAIGSSDSDSNTNSVFSIGDWALANNRNIKFGYNDGSWHDFSSVSEVPLTGWQHLVVTYDSSKITFYLNGEKDGESALSATLPSASTNYFTIGARKVFGNYNSVEFQGYLDEVKYYSYALSEAEIKTLYNGSSAMVMGQDPERDNNGVAVSGANKEYCIPGDTAQCDKPVLELKMDEKVSGDFKTLYDTSGNGNNGTTYGYSAAGLNCAVRGKNGSSCLFEQDGDYVTCGTNASLEVQENTFSAWIYPNSISYGAVSGIIASKAGLISASGIEWGLRQDTGDLAFAYNDGAVRGWYVSDNSNLTVGQWYFVSIAWRKNDGQVDFYVNGKKTDTVDTTTGNIVYASDQFKVADQTANNIFSGYIDDVKLYNYARTPAQIAWDYNRGKPVAEWKFDEGEGVTAHDESGNGNHGTLTNMDAGTDWVDGRIDEALDFDGVDDVVLVGNNSALNSFSSFTIATWYNPTDQPGTGDGRIIFKKNGDWGDDYGLDHNHSSAGNLISFRLTTSALTEMNSVTPVIPNTGWHHIVGSWDGSNMYLYIDGILDAQTSKTGTLHNQGEPLYIGNHNQSNRYIKGQIDDVKIYNYALTAEQVKLDYNGGAVSFR